MLLKTLLGVGKAAATIYAAKTIRAKGLKSALKEPSVAYMISPALGAGVQFKSYVGSLYQEQIQAAEKRGANLEKAKADAMLRQVNQDMARLAEKTLDTKRYLDLVVALYGVAFACISYVGHLDGEARQSVNEFLGGITNQYLPLATLEKVDRMALTPPSIEEAYAIYRETGSSHASLFTEVVQLIDYLATDSCGTDKGLLKKWNQLSLGS